MARRGFALPWFYSSACSIRVRYCAEVVFLFYLFLVGPWYLDRLIDLGALSAESIWDIVLDTACLPDRPPLVGLRDRLGWAGL